MDWNSIYTQWENEVIAAIDGKSGTPRGKQHRRCPLSFLHPNGDAHPSFRITEKGIPICTCQISAQKGRVGRFSFIASHLGIDTWENRKKAVLASPDYVPTPIETREETPVQETENEMVVRFFNWPLWEQQLDAYQPLVSWLRNRGIDEQHQRLYTLGYTGRDSETLPEYLYDRLSIPYFVKGYLKGIRFRRNPLSEAPKKDRYKYIGTGTFRPYLFNQDALDYSYDRYYLVESELDVIALEALTDCNCFMSKPANQFNHIHAGLLMGKQVTFIRDNDNAGLESAAKIKELMPRVVIASCEQVKDVGEAIQMGIALPFLIGVMA